MNNFINTGYRTGSIDNYPSDLQTQIDRYPFSNNIDLSYKSDFECRAVMHLPIISWNPDFYILSSIDGNFLEIYCYFPPLDTEYLFKFDLSAYIEDSYKHLVRKIRVKNIFEVIL